MNGISDIDEQISDYVTKACRKVEAGESATHELRRLERLRKLRTAGRVNRMFGRYTQARTNRVLDRINHSLEHSHRVAFAANLAAAEDDESDIGDRWELQS